MSVLYIRDLYLAHVMICTEVHTGKPPSKKKKLAPTRTERANYSNEYACREYYEQQPNVSLV